MQVNVREVQKALRLFEKYVFSEKSSSAHFFLKNVKRKGIALLGSNVFSVDVLRFCLRNISTQSLHCARRDVICNIKKSCLLLERWQKKMIRAMVRVSCGKCVLVTIFTEEIISTLQYLGDDVLVAIPFSKENKRYAILLRENGCRLIFFVRSALNFSSEMIDVILSGNVSKDDVVMINTNKLLVERALQKHTLIFTATYPL